jgi:hypothetical protein
VSCIEIDIVGSQQRLKFFLEGLGSMMLFLVTNVAPHTLYLRLADSESRESRLPSKSSGVL